MGALLLVYTLSKMSEVLSMMTVLFYDYILFGRKLGLVCCIIL